MDQVEEMTEHPSSTPDPTDTSNPTVITRLPDNWATLPEEEKLAFARRLRLQILGETKKPGKLLT